jgi:hypothetical protein
MYIYVQTLPPAPEGLIMNKHNQSKIQKKIRDVYKIIKEGEDSDGEGNMVRIYIHIYCIHKIIMRREISYECIILIFEYVYVYVCI